MIRIVTDSTADFTFEEMKELNIDVVPLKVIFKDITYLDGVELKSKEFYQLLETKDYPTTSQPAPSQYYDVFKKYEVADEDVIYIGVSSKLSGSLQSANIAKADVKNRIEIIDTYNVALPLQILTRKAVKLREEGKSTDEIVKEIETLKNKVVLYAGFDTLEYLVKGGRISKVAGFAGTLLKIKPIIGVNDGKLEVISKTRGYKQMINSIFEITSKHNINKNEEIHIGYTKNDVGALQLKGLLEESGYKVGYVVEIGAVVGVHAGPGAVAIAFVDEHE